MKYGKPVGPKPSFSSIEMVPLVIAVRNNNTMMNDVKMDNFDDIVSWIIDDDRWKNNNVSKSSFYQQFDG